MADEGIRISALPQETALALANILVTVGTQGTRQTTVQAVAELLGLYNGARGPFSLTQAAGFNLNNFLENGWTEAPTGSTNAPTNGEPYLVFNQVVGSGGSKVIQEAIGYTSVTSSDSRKYRRIRTGGTWSAWIRIREAEAEVQSFASGGNVQQWKDISGSPFNLATFGVVNFSIPAGTRNMKFLIEAEWATGGANVYFRGSRDNGATWLATNTDYSTNRRTGVGTVLTGVPAASDNAAALNNGLIANTAHITTMELFVGAASLHPRFKASSHYFDGTNECFMDVTGRITTTGAINAFQLYSPQAVFSSGRMVAQYSL